MPLLATSVPLVQWGHCSTSTSSSPSSSSSSSSSPTRRCHAPPPRDSLVAQDAFQRRRLRVLHPSTHIPTTSTREYPILLSTRWPSRFHSVALSVLRATQSSSSPGGARSAWRYAASLTASSASGCPCRTTETQKPAFDKPCVFSLTGLPCVLPPTISKSPFPHNLTEGFLACHRSCGIWNDPALLARRIPEGDLLTLHQLSTGAFGDVLLGQLDGRRVAIKRLTHDHQTKGDALAFASEIALMAQLHHANIVAFAGVEWSKQWLVQAVSEFVEGGDLRSLLDADPSPTASSLSWANAKCQLAIDVAEALTYLHELSPVATLEVLKARHVLLSEDLCTAKLSLFAATRTRSVFGTSGGDASYRWLAPEVARGEPLTELSVIYSFGVLLWELDAHKTPYHDTVNPNGKPMSSFKVMLLVSRGDLQPTLSPECPEPVAALANECLSQDPARRPTAASIAYRLRATLKNEL